MKNYYVVVFNNGSTAMIQDKRELADQLGYSYSYINLCIARGEFVFLKDKQIKEIQIYKNEKLVQVITKKVRGGKA
ncbi:MAG: hypothetical protein ACRC15_02290 [Cetobacterium sp.]